MDDYHNFSESTSPIRLPALSGTQVLQDVLTKIQPIPTGLNALDDLLCRDASPLESGGPGGVVRGAVTEVYGPSGSGKTVFGMQLAAKAACDGSTVVWVDCSTRLPVDRLRRIVSAHNASSHKSDNVEGGNEQQSYDALERVKHLQLLRLPLLFALVAEPPAHFPPDGTSLIVIDNLSSLVLSSLPNVPTSTANGSGLATSRDDILRKDTISRRNGLIANVASALHKLAAIKNIAVVVLNSVSTMQRHDMQTLLRPALHTQQWAASTSTRLGLYRDFWPEDIRKYPGTQKQSSAHRPPFRLVQVERLSGKDVTSGKIPFIITNEGIQPAFAETKDQQIATMTQKAPMHASDDEDNSSQIDVDGAIDLGEQPRAGAIEHDNASTHDEATSAARSKRKADEIADSEDEDADGIAGGLDGSEVKLPTARKPQGGFLPSSQLMQDSTQSNGESPLLARKTALRAKEPSSPGMLGARDDDDIPQN